MGSNRNKNKHMFSIELRSTRHLKSLALNLEGGKIIVEGFLGNLENLSLIEGSMLEVTGANGSLRMDLSETELKKLHSKKEEKNIE